MKQKILIIILFIAVDLSLVYSQSNTFMRLEKVDNLQFGLSITQTNDGGLVGTGQDNGSGGSGSCDLYIYKVNECGENQWYRRYGDSGTDAGLYVKQTKDNGYIVTGVTTSYGNGGNDIWFLRLDDQGNMLWSRTFGTAGDDHGRCVDEMPNGDFLISGHSGNVPIVIRIDKNGNLIFQKKISLISGIANYVESFNDSSILVLGQHNGSIGGIDMFAIKLDMNGNLIWGKEMGGSGTDGYEYDVAGKIFNNNSFFIGGTTTSFGSGHDMLSARFDGQGNLLWSTRVYTNQYERAHYANGTDDGGILQCGFITASNGFGSADIIVNRLDSNGNHLWSRLYGGSGIDKGWGVLPTKDNGYMISALTTSFNAIHYDPLFIKTDSVGLLDNCNNVKTPSVNVDHPNLNVKNISPGISNISILSGSPVVSPTTTQIQEELVCFSCKNEPAFILSDTILCENEPLNIINKTSVGLVCDQNWFIEDSNGQSLNNFPGSDTLEYIFSDAGLYNIILQSYCVGVINSDTTPIFINKNPEAEFVFYDTCINTQPIQLTNTSTGSVLDQWSFGNGDSSNVNNPQVLYSSTGNYDIELVTKSIDNCYDTIMHTLSIFDKPNANFTYNDTCQGLPHSLNSTSSSNGFNIITHQWAFGDGNSSGIDSTQHIYSTNGSYDVELIVQDQNGCFDTIIKTINSYGPNAEFTFNDTCQGLTSYLNSISSSNISSIKSYQWDLGNGQTATSAAIQYIYPNTGTHNVSLIVEDQNACFDTISHTLEVFDRPVAGYTFNDTCLGLPNFMNNTSSSSVSTITGNFWAFGDGNVSSTSSAQHTFSSPGLYNTELIVVDQNGCFDTIIQNISVFNNPNALFTFNDTCIGFANHLNSISSSPNGNIMTHQWSFGDGQSSSIDSTQHIYSSSGSYDVELIVLDQLGCYDTMMHTIRVHEKPHTDFNFNNACFGEPVIFNNNSSIGTPYSLSTFEWDLDNGISSNVHSPQEIYNAYGTYNIQLIVNSDKNCVDSLTKQLIIHPLPNTEFSADPLMACEPAIINFTDLTSNNSNQVITDWAWTFGDGGTSILSNPSHLYVHSGSGLIKTYDVSLTAKNIFGCLKDTLIENYITILKKPTAGFDTDLLQKLPDFKIKVNDASSSDVVKWEYDFGFGTTDTIASPYYIYQDSGLYKIYQVVQNSVGCKDTSDFYILLKPDPVVYLPTAFSPNSDGMNDILYVRGIEIDEIRFSIFNRWGKMLFRTDDINNGWDGTYMGDRLQPAVFIYTLDVLFNNGEKEYMKGNVTLVR